MADVFPYQRLSLDAGILSHRNRMLIPEDGGKRPMSGDRIRTSLATLHVLLGRLRAVGVTGLARVSGGNDATFWLTWLGSHATRSSTVMMLSKSVVTTLSLCLVAVYASARPVQQSWSSRRVPVTLGVMSRCPDALLCETLFDNVIPRVVEKIDISLAYVATYVPTQTLSNPSKAYRCPFSTVSMDQIQISASLACTDLLNAPEMYNSCALQSTRQ